MNVLLTYDIRQTSTTIHTELKDRLKKNYHFTETIQADGGGLYLLPNTTLIKDNITIAEATKEFLNACNEVGAHWEKYIVTERGRSQFANQK